MHTQAGALDWEVVIPDKRPATTWGVKQKGTVVLHDSEGGVEYLKVPLAVARQIARKKDAGELNPASRVELLASVEEISRKSVRARIERMIDRREYSTSEVRSKLRQDGYPHELIDECLAYACQIGLVSDARFADAFIRSKLSAGWGMARIERELAQKGINASEVRGWPYEYLDPEDELTRACQIAARRQVSGGRAYEKLVRHLCSKGFSLGVSCRAARSVLDDEEADILVDF